MSVLAYKKNSLKQTDSISQLIQGVQARLLSKVAESFCYHYRFQYSLLFLLPLSISSLSFGSILSLSSSLLFLILSLSLLTLLPSSFSLSSSSLILQLWILLLLVVVVVVISLLSLRISSLSHCYHNCRHRNHNFLGLFSLKRSNFKVFLSLQRGIGSWSKLFSLHVSHFESNPQISQSIIFRPS